MNTVWLKIAGVAVALVVVLIVGSKFMGGDANESPEPTEGDKPKTVYDTFERDDKEFGVDPERTEAAQPPAPTPAPQPAPAPTQPTFEKLSMEDEVQAQKLHSFALQQRKQSRLPGMSPKIMVDNCREIIRRWPKSEYAFQAKRMMADLPERHKKTYNITDAETDVSGFYQ